MENLCRKLFDVIKRDCEAMEFLSRVGQTTGCHMMLAKSIIKLITHAIIHGT